MARNQRILVINPIMTNMFDRFNKSYFQSRAGQSFTIDVASLAHGAETIEEEYDDAMCAPYIVDKVMEAQAKNYDAAIIDCFRDPGLGAARQASEIVVVGPGEASMLLSMTLGDSFSIIDVGLGRYKRYAPPARVRQLGISGRFVSERGADINVVSIPEDMKKTVSAIVNTAKEIQREDEPDVVILGCTGLSQVADLVAKQVEIPLIDPSLAALSMTKALLLSGLKRSRKTYPKPAEKKRSVPGSKFLK
jgi:allantoin racemase